MDKDLRYRILNEFKDMSTGEAIANEFLSKQHKDLGSIQRALIELIDADSLCFSDYNKTDAIKWLKENK